MGDGRDAARRLFTVIMLACSLLVSCGGESEPCECPWCGYCPHPYCGDGILNRGEECDSSDLAGETCESLGFTDGGTLACDDSCTFDTSDCALCGNDVIEPGEECEGEIPDDVSCASIGEGFNGGELSCHPDCLYDTSRCVTTCGDGILDDGEECDDGNDASLDGCQDCLIGEFRILSGYLDWPDVSIDAGGRFAVLRGGGAVFSCQLFDEAAESVGSVVHPPVHSVASRPASVSMSADGGFLATWRGTLMDDDGQYHAFMRWYSPDGVAEGPEIELLPVLGSSFTQAMALTGDDNIVLVKYDAGSFQLVGRLYDEEGTALGDEFTVSSGAGNDWGPVLDVASDGSFVVAWQRGGVFDGLLDIIARRFDRDGTALGPEFMVNEIAAGRKYATSVATSDAGAFVVAWSHERYEPGPIDIVASHFGPGAVTGEHLTVSESGWAPLAAMNSAGAFTVIWQNRAYEYDTDVGLLQRFSSDGEPMGSAQVVNRFTSLGDFTTDMAPNGISVVVWDGRSPGDDDHHVFAQRYDASGNPIGALPW